MNNKKYSGNRSRSGSGPFRRPSARPSSARPTPFHKPRPKVQDAEPDFQIVEHTTGAEVIGPFRILIAVHRPRYRGRAERASALEGWQVMSLLNKQDPVGQVAKPPRPPDLLVLSGDFGRQKDYAIFRAVQAWRSKGMILIGMVEDCDTAPEGHPDSVPSKLCDVCLTPPYKAADLRALFTQLYEAMRGEPAPTSKAVAPTDAEDDDD